MSLRELFPEVFKGWEYTYVTGLIRAQEKHLLTPELLEQLVESPTLENTWNLLETTVFSSIRDRLTGLQDFEQALDLTLSEAYGLVRSLRPLAELGNWLTSKYDFHNIKVGIKRKYEVQGQNGEGTVLNCLGIVSPERLLEVLHSKQFPLIPEIYADTIRMTLEEFDREGDPQCIDVMIDKAMFSYLLRETRQEQVSEFIQRYFRAMADFYNLLSFFRIRIMDRGPEFLQKVLVPGGQVRVEDYLELYSLPFSAIKARLEETPYGQLVSEGLQHYEQTGSLGQLEKLADDFLIDLVKPARALSLGPEVILGYLVAKENDIKNLRIIWQGKLLGIPKEEIRTNLRKTYV